MVLAIGALILFDASFAFLKTESAFNQASIAILQYLVYIVLIWQVKILYLFKSIVIGFWIASILIHIINYVSFPIYEDWINNFNYLHFERLLFTLSTMILTLVYLRYRNE